MPSKFHNSAPACSESSGSVRRPRLLTLLRGWRINPAIEASHDLFHITPTNLVSFYVAEVGIPATLRRAAPSISSDSAALDRAIREGVTRNSLTNQENGLFGTFKCCEVSRGTFSIFSEPDHATAGANVNKAGVLNWRPHMRKIVDEAGELIAKTTDDHTLIGGHHRLAVAASLGQKLFWKDTGEPVKLDPFFKGSSH